MLNCAHTVTVEVTVPDGAEGVLFAMGGNDGGFSFFVQNGKLTYGYNYVADEYFKVEVERTAAEGTSSLQLRVRADRQGRCR